MIDKLRSFLFGDADGKRTGDGETIEMATAVLLVEAGLMDGTLGDEERASIRGLLASRFDMTPERADALLGRAVAEAEQATELYSHARNVKDRFTYEERVEIVEMLWQVVYADGELHDYEANLMRRLNRLLYVEDRDSGEARKRVLARLGLDGPDASP